MRIVISQASIAEKIVGRAYLLRFKHSVLKSDRTAYLIPWPGPHVIYLMSTFNEPDPIDMQSSPVRWPLSEMVRSWCWIENENIQKLSRITNWDDWIIYSNWIRVLYMKPMSVGTMRGWVYHYGIYQDIFTFAKSEMKLWTGPNFQSFDSQIGAHEEPYGLHSNMKVFTFRFHLHEAYIEARYKFIFSLQQGCHKIQVMSFNWFPVAQTVNDW